MSTFNAGAIEASLTLDRSSWVRDLKKTQQEVDRLESTSITIGVDADTINADVALDNLERNLDMLENDPVNISIDADADLADAEAQLDAFEQTVRDLDGFTIHIDIDVDTAAAETQLINFFAQANQLSGNTIDVGVDLDASVASARLNGLQLQVDALDGRTININTNMGKGGVGGGGGGRLSLLKILIMALIALSPILAVAIGAATAAIVAFASALVGAAGPVLLLAGVIASLVARYNEAKEAGKGMTAPMREFGDAIQMVKDAWNTLLDSVSPEVFDLMAGALRLVAGIIPMLTPIIENMADAFGDVLQSIGEFVASPEMNRLIDFFSGFGVDMFSSFMAIGGNLILFFGRLFEAIEPFARSMMSGLEQVTKGWADWSNGLRSNDGFQQFMDAAASYGPAILDMLGSLLQALIHVGEALAPFAGPMISFFTMLFDAITAIPTPILTVLIGLFAALYVAFQFILPAVSAIIAGFGVISTVIGAISLPVVAVIAGILALAAGLYFLWRASQDAGSGLGAAFMNVSAVVMPVVQALVGFIVSNIPRIRQVFADVMHALVPLVTDALVIVAATFRIFTAIFQAVWRVFGTLITALTRNAFQTIIAVIRGAFQIVRGVFQVIRGVLTGDWRMVWQGIQNILRGAVNVVVALIRGMRNTLSAVMSAVGNAIRNIWNGIWNAVTSRLRTAVGAIGNGLSGIVNFVRGLGGRIASAASGIWNGLTSGFRSAINGIIGGWNGLHFSVPGINPPGPLNFPGFSVSVPSIPYLAEGAVITDPTLAMVGEGRESEAVMPLSKLQDLIDTSGDRIDYGRLAAALSAALETVLGRRGESALGGLTAEELALLLEAAAPNVSVDVDSPEAQEIVSALGYTFRRLGYGGK